MKIIRAGYRNEMFFILFYNFKEVNEHGQKNSFTNYEPI